MNEIWDAVIVGAGPAGSVAARELARLGRQVLLVDKAHFPRGKVCGCCLNQSALSSLTRIGLAHLTKEADAEALHQVQLASGGTDVTLPLPGGVALSRTALDQALIEEAQQAGAHFRQGETAKLGPLASDSRTIFLNGEPVRSRVVLAADGLNGQLLQSERPKPELRPDSRIGAGVMLHEYPRFYGAGTIFMAVGTGGYVGLVQVEQQQLDIAAAFDPEFVRQAGGLGNAAAQILQQAGWPAIPDLSEQPWRGTTPLTRTPRQLAGERWWAIGDAAGYVEPFTGEGMAWAIASGIAIAPLAAQPWRPEFVDQWTALHRRLIRSRQTVCRLLAEGLRRPQLCRVAIRLLKWFPSAAVPVVRRLNHPAFSTWGGPR